ncbi:hypothetical protein QT13_05270 [Pectobacterium brasiliense]|nr:hypothetical protein QT13_05270 [Pectobacterium brasiliense]
MDIFGIVGGVLTLHVVFLNILARFRVLSISLGVNYAEGKADSRISGMDAAQADAASGTRQRRSAKRMLFPKAPHSGIISRQKSQGSKGDGN